MLFNNSFILASSSSSRYKILKNNKLVFSKKKPLCDEGALKKRLIQNQEKPRKISLELARLKSKSISVKNKNKLVVGCDTIIFFNGFFLSKAKNLKEAKRKIMKISGQEHHVYSSASVYYNMREVWKSSLKTKIKIRKLAEKEIDEYLLKAGKHILSSVGCYQVELLGPNIIEEIKGDFFNVMGFPLFPFLNFLKKFNGDKL